MGSDLECGVCSRPYNVGQRCPRELHCEHCFCESCPADPSRPQDGWEPCAVVGQEETIGVLCPLCRQVTSISGDGEMTAAVRVDKFNARTFDHQGDVDVDGDCDCEVTDGKSLPARPLVKETDSPSREKFNWSLKRAWKKITGHNRSQRKGAHVMSNDDFRDFMMWCSKI